MTTRPAALLLSLIAACASDEGGPASDTTPAGAVPAPTDWCDAFRAGPPGDIELPVGLSVAHLDARLFGPSGDWLGVDEVLVRHLAGPDPWTPDTLDAYAGDLPDVCAAPAEPEELGAARVEVVQRVAVVVPGTGDLQLPSGVDAVAVDLREVPATPEGDAAIDRAVGLALGRETSLGERQLRAFKGFPTQQPQGGVYETSLAFLPDALQPGADEDLPLALLTGPRLSPHAAAVAGGLRVERRAWILGRDVFAAVAEGRWHGLGDHGLLVRVETRVGSDGDPWPDVVEADRLADDPVDLVGELAGWPDPDRVTGRARRDPMQAYDPVAGAHPSGDDPSSRRAAMLVAHGTLERFFPYFDVVGDHIDAALLGALAEVDALADGDRLGTEHALGRFLHVLQDGHAFFGGGGEAPTGYLAVQIQQVDGEAVVRTSRDPALLPGDTVVSIDGTPAEDWLAESMARHSAASQGYLFDLAVRELQEVHGERTLGLRDPDGVERTVRVSGGPLAEAQEVAWGGTLRPNGWLDDLGAPGVFFLNLNSLVTDEWSQVESVLAVLDDADGLVVDMRDYPAIDHYTLVQHLVTEPFASPRFGIPVLTGPPEMELVDEQFQLEPLDPFTGPIVLLVSNKTVSAAENFSQMLVTSPAVTVMGQPSAATNGNITYLSLPGGFYAMFTGMRITNPDGSRFHGLGIPVDVVVEPTAADFRDGRDPELAAAAERLAP